MPDDNDETDYAQKYDEQFSMRVRPRSLVSRGSKVVKVDIRDKVTGEWRTAIRMSRTKFDEKAKEVFLLEYAKWGRMGESAAAAGVSTLTVRRHMEEDEEFAEAFYMQEEEYRDKLIGHHQNLLFNGTQKTTYDRNGGKVSEETIYPIRLIELELKKHDKGYRDKQEIAVNHSGGVMIAPAEMADIDDWETRFGAAKDITPVPPLLGDDNED
tara:strand:+ start:1783 stop:2418 length:636 start_codon:yes stop_codon:yes gene_type:complete